MDTYPLAAATFKKYLTQNLLMAFAAYLFVYLGLAARPAALRATWLALAVLAAANAALLNPGRSGQLILAALLLYLAYSLWRWKGVLTVAGAMAIAMLLLGFDGRLAQTINDLKAWQPGEPTFTSTGKRLEFYRNSYPIALEHPLIGNGTGSFPRLYAEHTAGSPVTPTDNPHNEYLSIAVQTGVIGLLAMLYLFYCELRFAARLPRFERHMARAVFITMAIGCLFNSLLLDHTEGLFFAWASGVFFGALQPATPRPGTPP
jgi:O-antigen ligase